MPNFILLSTALVLLHTAHSAPGNAPWKNWSYCKNPNPTQSSTCIIKAIQGTEKDLIDGSTYFGLPKMNPLHIDELALYQAGSRNSVAVNITFRNCEVTGLLGWELSNALADWDNGDLKGTVKFSDKVFFDADYEVDGKVILLPVKGNGKAKIAFDSLSCDLHIKGNTITKKNKKYFNVDSFMVDLHPQGAKFRFSDPLNGNSAFGESINRALTENWQVIMEDVRGPIGEGLGAAFKQISNRVFSKIPYDVLVPK